MTHNPLVIVRDLVDSHVPEPHTVRDDLITTNISGMVSPSLQIHYSCDDVSVLYYERKTTHMGNENIFQNYTVVYKGEIVIDVEYD
jgi:hypothetical protein